MLNNLKALVVVLVIAWAVFFLARPLCLRFMSEEAFSRRRNVWLALTAVAFVSPVFWIYALVALVVLYWASRRDDNPLALYAMVTFVIPNVNFYIPGLIFNQLFDLTQERIASLAIIVPCVFRMWREPGRWGAPGLRKVDVLLLAFLLLQVVLLIPYESVTNTMRRTFLFAIDTFVVVYAFSRIADREKIADVMACFWLMCAIMAPIAIFEWSKGWLLYTGMASLWGDPNVLAWLMRGDSLRAQVSAGHSIHLGYLLSMGLAFFLYLRRFEARTALAWLGIGVFSVGVLVTGSRAAWLTAALAVVLVTVLRPNAGRQLARALMIGVALVAIMYVTPLRESVLDRLPIIGTADQDTVDYRRQLAEVSWQLIKQNPMLGDPFAYLHMESLRQGQGIIDIVNGYVYTALFTGLVGLTLQVGVLLVSLAYGLRAWLQARSQDADAGLMGAALLACLLANLFFVGTGAFETTTYVLCGLLVSYASSLAPTWASAAWPSGDHVSFRSRPVG